MLIYQTLQPKRLKAKRLHKTYWRTSLQASVLEADALLDKVLKDRSSPKRLKKPSIRIPWSNHTAARNLDNTWPAKEHRLIGLPKKLQERHHRQATCKWIRMLLPLILPNSSRELSWTAKPQLKLKQSRKGSKANIRLIIVCLPIITYSLEENNSNKTRHCLPRSCKHI